MWKTIFPWTRVGVEGWGERFGDNLSTLHLLWTLFLLLLHQLHLRPQALDPEGWGPLL